MHKFPISVLGFGLVAFGRVVLGFWRAYYLKRASKNIAIDASKEITLRYAIWYHTYPLGCFAIAAFMGWAGLNEANVVRFRFDVAIFLFMFVGGIWLAYRQWAARITIVGNKLVYAEGDRREVSANEVDSVTLTGFTFIVKKRSEKIVRIPATFEHSEIILAFLKQAAVNKNDD